MLTATALVMLMSLPGLAIFYGGLAKAKDTLNTIAMVFTAYAIASVVWVIYGYTLAFGTDIGGVIGSLAKPSTPTTKLTLTNTRPATMLAQPL